MTAPHDFHKELEKLLHFIEDAATQVESGKLVAMDSMQHHVELLCRQIEGAPGPVAHNLKPLLMETISRLDLLEARLRDLKSQLETKAVKK